MRRSLLKAVALALAAAASAAARTGPASESREQLAARVRAREQAFAKTMADRDHAAFAGFVSEEAVFVGRTVRRGRRDVVEGWKPYFEGARAPFSWQPETVEVIDSGTLALSRGPVFDEQGQRSGTFTSTWRREPDGEWRVVLDSGCPPCACP
jgi:ketosteroid isomerase-like protein